MHYKLYKGSTIATTLLYLTLMMVAVLGVASLTTRLLHASNLSFDSVQTNYNSESALELALYDLKLHKEGYETPGLSSSDSSYTIKYRSQTVETTITKEVGTKKLALFIDNGSSLLPPSSPLVTSASLPNGAYQSDCLELKLTGLERSTNESHSISTSLNCGETVDITNKVVPIRYNSTTTTSLPISTFLNEHKEVYLLLRNTNRNQDTISFSLSSSPEEIASGTKIINAIGRDRSTVIKRRVEFEQDQVPEILSTAILHN